MLKVSQISNIEIHSPQWHQGRLAKITSSKMFTQCDDRPFTVGAESYILERVGEEMTGIPANEEIDTNATRWGLLHEREGTIKFGQEMGFEFLVTQKMIIGANPRFSSTPDAIHVKRKIGDAYDVATAEIKCYPSYPNYIRCTLCSTPAEIKEVDKKLYWQVLDQMDNCDCMEGYAVFYHPDFKVSGLKIIHFRKKDLIKDFQFLQTRKRMAEEKFNEFRTKLINNPVRLVA